MAPSAVETITVPVTTQPLEVKPSYRGVYKELAPLKYDKDSELKGKEGFEAAKVCCQRMFVFYHSHTQTSADMIHPDLVPSLSSNLEPGGEIRSPRAI